MSLLTYTLHAAGSTGTGRQSIRNLADCTRAEIEFVVENVGATPTVTFQVEGLRIGGDPTVAADWTVLSLLTADASVATSSTAITVTATGNTRRYIDGLDKRFFDALAINVTANTNITFHSNLNRADRF